MSTTEQKLRDALEMAVNLLGAADCPQCYDKAGAYYDQFGEPCQCQWCDEVETVQKALALPAEPSVPVSELEALIKHIESLDTGSSYDPVISTAHCRRLVKKIIKKAKEQEK
jgi:hypothetical protein